jgi:hypothetical protein
MMRKRAILRLTKVTAQMCRDRLKLKGWNVGDVVPYGTAWAVVVRYRDGEQDQLPLGVQDGPE